MRRMVRRIEVRVDDKLAESLAKIAGERGISVNELSREALAVYCKGYRALKGKIRLSEEEIKKHIRIARLKQLESMLKKRVDKLSARINFYMMVDETYRLVERIAGDVEDLKHYAFEPTKLAEFKKLCETLNDAVDEFRALVEQLRALIMKHPAVVKA